MFESLDLKIAEQAPVSTTAGFSGVYNCNTQYFCVPSHVGCTPACPV